MRLIIMIINIICKTLTIEINEVNEIRMIMWYKSKIDKVREIVRQDQGNQLKIRIFDKI